MSGRFGKPQLLDPGLEQRPGVVGARTGLGMKLQRPRPLAANAEPFDRSVVQGDVRDLGGIAFDRETMVLACDQHPVGRDLEDWMIGSSVSEGELEGAKPRCQ